MERLVDEVGREGSPTDVHGAAPDEVALVEGTVEGGFEEILSLVVLHQVEMIKLGLDEVMLKIEVLMKSIFNNIIKTLLTNYTLIQNLFLRL